MTASVAVQPKQVPGWLPWAWSLGMGVAICAPLLLRRGFALTRDMVFVPHEPFKAAWLGLDGSVPRAVPSDAVVSVLTSVVPGDLLQKAVLVALLVFAGAGIAAVVRPAAGVLGMLAASTLYVWNPYVYERLAMGQWALMCGYAALPWVAVGALRVRRTEPRAWPLIGIALAAAAFTSPTGGVLAALVCLGLLAGSDRSVTLRAIGISIAVNLPWIVPSMLYVGGIPADATGVSAFTARPDTPYGTLGSLLTLGGIWNVDVIPPGRDGWVLSGALLVVCAAALAGLRWSRGVVPDVPIRRWLLLGGLGLVLAALPALPGGTSTMEWVDVHVPGAGLLRDSQKWVALLALVAAVGAAALVTMLRRRWARHGGNAVWWLVLAAVVVPVAVSISLVWGLAGRLQPVTYPRDWSAVASLLDHGPGSGDVAVLPWSIYRQFGWNDDRPLLDPAPRYLPGDVVIADTLVVGREAVSGEDTRAARIGALLARGGDVTAGLRRLGIGRVVVERGTPGVGHGVALHGRLLYDGRWLQLWDIGPPASGPAGPSTAAQAATVAGDLVALAVLAGSLVLVTPRARRRYTRR